jgi:hypothetical protein
VVQEAFYFNIFKGSVFSISTFHNRPVILVITVKKIDKAIPVTGRGGP